MSPSNGQPNAVEMAACTGMPAERAMLAMSSMARRLSSTVRLRLARLWLSEAEMMGVISSIRAAAARSAPRALGASARNTVPRERSTRASTSSASRIWGIARGPMKETISIVGKPQPASASMRRTLSAVAMNWASIWKPSRAPTSMTLIAAGEPCISYPLRARRRSGDGVTSHIRLCGVRVKPALTSGPPLSRKAARAPARRRDRAGIRRQS